MSEVVVISDSVVAGAMKVARVPEEVYTPPG